MTWAEKYASLQTWEQRGSIFRAPTSVLCEVCGRPTEFIDMDYEAAFCSDDCLKEFEKELNDGLMYCCDTCEIGQKRNCPHAKGIHYNPWGEGIEPPEFCPNRMSEELPF